MLNFIARRVFQSIFVMLTVGLIAFSMFRYVGDPINNMVGQDTTMEQRAEMRRQLGLDDPFMVQYLRFIGNAVQGDFGMSYRQRRPVGELIDSRMPATLARSFVSALLAMFLVMTRGISTALRRDGELARRCLTVSPQVRQGVREGTRV